MSFGIKLFSSILKTKQTSKINHGIRYIAMFSNTLKHSERKLVCVPPEIMYNVVADVSKYKEFIPYCTRSDITVRNQHFHKAVLSVGFGPVKEHYKSKLTFNKPSFVHSVCTDGRLFNLLDCTWEFLPTTSPNRCIVEFNVVFEFRSLVYTKLATMFFNEIVKTMVLSFEKRALHEHKIFLLKQKKRHNLPRTV